MAQSIAGEFALNYHETSALEGLGFTEMIDDVMSQTYLQKVRPKLQLGPSTAASSDKIDSQASAFSAQMHPFTEDKPGMASL